MEAVLPTLCSNVSQVYNKRKLSCYKYSVYSLGDGKGYCYLWNESEGQRGGHRLVYHLTTILPISIFIKAILLPLH